MSKINFVINPEASAESILSLLNSGFEGETKKSILLDHPDLENVLVKEGKELERGISSYVIDYYKQNKKRIGGAKERIEKEWRKVEKDVFFELSKLLKTNWRGLGKITCNISIFQMFPRDLESLSFDVFFEDYVSRSMAVILHELTHFIYFKKWHEMFPEDKEETFEYPHKFWYLSEIMAPIINGEESLLKLIPKAEVGAEEEEALDYFKGKYVDYKKKEKSVEEFLKFAREEIEKFKLGQ